MLIKLGHSTVLHTISLGRDQGNKHTHTYSIPFDYSLLLFQVYSALSCPFCVSGMMERSSLICLAVTTAMSKLLTLCWLFQWAHYNLQLNKDSPEICCLFVSCIVFLIDRLFLKRENAGKWTALFFSLLFLEKP